MVALGKEAFIKLVHYAYDKGITYVDAAQAYATFDWIGDAIKGLPREKLFLQSKVPGQPADVLAAIDNHRKTFNTDYIDSLLIHCMSAGEWTDQWKRVMDGFNEAKEKKWIRAKGVSCHSLPALRAGVASDWTEVHLVRVNPQAKFTDGMTGKWDEAGDIAPVMEQIKLMHEKGHGVIGMKLIGNGTFKDPATARSPFAMPWPAKTSTPSSSALPARKRSTKPSSGSIVRWRSEARDLRLVSRRIFVGEFRPLVRFFSIGRGRWRRFKIGLLVETTHPISIGSYDENTSLRRSPQPLGVCLHCPGLGRAGAPGRRSRRRPAGFDRYPSLAEAGDGHPTDRRRQALPGFGWRVEQRQRHQPRVHGPDVAEARAGEDQHRAGGRFLEPDRTAGRKVRLQRPGRRDPGARSNNLRLVLLWFASWKNGLSSYPPDWVKKDFERFPRARTRDGKTVELLTPLSDANRDADARAFAALMRHVKEVDGREHTVLMIQVENEVGMHGDTRDRSALAEKAYRGARSEGTDGLPQQHKETLIPEFRQVWAAAGFKTSGTWEEVFGRNTATDDIFMAWNYARYVGRVVEAGKAEYPLPMFVNAALIRSFSIADAARMGNGPAARRGHLRPAARWTT